MKAISKHTEPQNDRLDDLAQLEPVTEPEIEYAKLLQLCMEQCAEIEAANKDLNAAMHREMALQGEIATLRAALERTVDRGN